MQMDSERILVTGSAGFIGSHVAGALLSRGARVVGVDNFDPYYDVGRKRRNHAGLEAAHGGAFEAHELDITDDEALGGVMRSAGVTGVIHLAAKAGVRPSIADPGGYALANVVGTQRVLSAASAAGGGAPGSSAQTTPRSSARCASSPAGALGRVNRS